MALIRVTTPQRESWQTGDELRLLLGAENALDMTGAEVVARTPAHADDDEPRTLAYEHVADDVCAVMPLALKVADGVDGGGNVSDLFEGLIQLDDAPQGARDVAVAGTGETGEARLSWSTSPHIED